jgi:hypothetical protein
MGVAGVTGQPAGSWIGRFDRLRFPELNQCSTFLPSFAVDYLCWLHLFYELLDGAFSSIPSFEGGAGIHFSLGILHEGFNNSQINCFNDKGNNAVFHSLF